MRKNYKALYNTKIVIDTNSILDLQELDLLDIPPKIFSKVFIPDNILIEEIDDPLVEELLNMNYIEINLKKNLGFEKYSYLNDTHKKLSTSDKIVICIAYENKFICCTNDKRARNACKELGTDVIGTLGILCAGYESNIIKWNDFVTAFNKYGVYTSARIDDSIKNEIKKLYDIPNIIEYNQKAN
ncbi:hypothetical protein [Clostridium sp. BJN0013]|uniref:hypothetical protein n=1 Tax=Clostridium sp. BJN0013 TaxID=3236840 RepID=UPI0034C6C6AF